MDGGPLDLLADAREGKPEALGELCALYRNYLSMIVRTGMGPRLRERVELSDVVQETLVEVIRQFPQFNGQTEMALVGWLRRLVAQKLADLGRYHSRIKRSGAVATFALDAPWETGGGDSQGGEAVRLLDMLALSQTSPSELASRRELTVLLADALSELPSSEAEVLWMYHAEGLSFESIAERLGLGRKAVRGLWARGLKGLRKTLDKS